MAERDPSDHFKLEAMVPDSADANRREDTRYKTVMRVAKLFVRGRETLCLVRNISAGGLMAQVYQPFNPADRLEIEFASELRVAGEIAWVEDPHVGVRFDQKIEVLEALGVPEDFRRRGYKLRRPRVPLAGRATLRTNGRYLPVEILDVSQGGLKVASAERLPLNAPVSVITPNHPALSGNVRWQRDGHIGIAFAAAIPLDDLAGIVETALPPRPE